MQNRCGWILGLLAVATLTGCYWRPGYYLNGGQYSYAPYQYAQPAYPQPYAQPVVAQPPAAQPVMTAAPGYCVPCDCN
jgi:hypothetical protein